MIRLTRAQIREVDRRAINDYGIPGIVLMENAARSCSELAIRMLADAPKPEVAIICGGGNNGGDGLAIARQLHIAGIAVTIIPTWTAEPTGDAAINLDIVQAMKLPMVHAHDTRLDRFALIIDCLFGTGLKRPIGGDEALVVQMINAAAVPVLACDLPSGLDCDTGEPLGQWCVRATQTVTFVAEKTGFANPRSRAFTGPVVVAGIGAPMEIVHAVLSDSAGEPLS
ncbi:MAG TPA: NAD(P)H-hydrate epimerase [Tepidisphaeraceae bacterium]|nr:NAD(P)H-hydrate epimerase [Tepidisphaeraceae bacterium]